MREQHTHEQHSTGMFSDGLHCVLSRRCMHVLSARSPHVVLASDKRRSRQPGWQVLQTSAVVVLPGTRWLRQLLQARWARLQSMVASQRRVRMVLLGPVRRVKLLLARQASQAPAAGRAAAAPAPITPLAAAWPRQLPAVPPGGPPPPSSRPRPCASVTSASSHTETMARGALRGATGLPRTPMRAMRINACACAQAGRGVAWLGRAGVVVCAASVGRAAERTK